MRPTHPSEAYSAIEQEIGNLLQVHPSYVWLSEPEDKLRRWDTVRGEGPVDSACSCSAFSAAGAFRGSPRLCQFWLCHCWLYQFSCTRLLKCVVDNYVHFLAFQRVSGPC